MTSAFIASIEDTHGHYATHPYHLGAQIALAKELIEEIFENRTRYGFPVLSIALMRAHRIIDVYYGEHRWFSSRS